MAFLAQKRVAAVAGTIALDTQFLRKMHDETALRIQLAGRMQPAHEPAFVLDALQRTCAHPGHLAHIGHDIGTVGDFNAQTRQRRINGPHAVGNHVHGTTCHAVFEQAVHQFMRLVRRHPVVVRPGVVAIAGTHVGQMLDARDIIGVGPVQVALRMGLLVQFQQLAGIEHRVDQRGVFLGAAGTPVNLRRMSPTRDGIDPFGQFGQLGSHERFQRFGKVKG